MRRWKLLPDGTVTTLVEPVEYRFYFFSMARDDDGGLLEGQYVDDDRRLDG